MSATVFFLSWAAGCGPAGRTADRPDLGYEDVAAAAGLTEPTVCGTPEKRAIIESSGCGAAMVDVDNDGDLDIYLVNALRAVDEHAPGPGNRLYLNVGGLRFREASRGSGADLTLWGTGCCAGDFDNDGDVDIYVTAFGRNALLDNHGNGIFAEVALERGVADPGFSSGCAFFDADFDGRLDLYVVHYVKTSWREQAEVPRDQPWRGAVSVMRDPTFHGYEPEPDSFFRNRGDGTFENASEAAGFRSVPPAWGRGVAAADLDLDGRVDVYVANDLQPNFLFRNLGDGRFEEIGLGSGAAVNADGGAQAGKGVDTGDVDLDGLPDLFVTNFATEPNTLFRNLGGMMFRDETAARGLAEAGRWPMGWACLFLDADLDGRPDLLVANGHDYPQVDDAPDLRESYRQRNQLFLNRRTAFVDVSNAAGPAFAAARSSRGACAGDLDDDGNLEILVTHQDAPPSLIKKRSAAGAHWLIVALNATRSNRSSVGALVVVEAGGTRRICEVRSGRGYASHSDLRCHFGLGAEERARVEVRWPSGKTAVRENVPADRVITMVEP